MTTKYGVSLFDIKKDYAYSLFCNYFDNPVMVKIKDLGDSSIYAIRVYSLLGIENRYIIATVPKDNNPNDHNERLKDLFWTSLQTRSLESIGKNLPIHSYKIKRELPYQTKIILENREERLSNYKAENLPIKISLMHKTKDIEEYQKEGSIINALETFSTIITFT